MANYKEQMEMFNLGGLKDQGETIDRKSRNKVPVGSLKKEVRDDVPINISEGEFVLPADVVRYHGLEKIMNMRQNAKSGLKLMDKMGQMGNSDQATLPDDIPFQPQNYQEGGAIVAPQIQMPEIQQQNQVPGVNVAPPQQLGMRPSVYAQQQQPVKVTTPSSPTYSTFGAPQYTSPTSTAATPDYSKLVGASFGQLPKSETKRYFNKETGEELYIPFIDGKPVYPIPNGFVEQEEAKKEEEAKDPTKSRVETTKVIETGDDPQQELDTPEYRIASTLSSKQGSGTGIGKALATAGSFMVNPLLTIGYGVSKLLGSEKEDRKAIEGFDEIYGKGEAIDDPYMDAESVQEQLAQQSGFTSYADMAKNYGVNPTFKFGYNKGDVSPVTGKTYNYAGQSESSDGSVAYSSFEDFANAMKASAATGWYGGTMTKSQIQAQIDAAKAKGQTWDRTKIDAYNAMMGKTYNKVTPEGSDGDGDKKSNQLSSGTIQAGTTGKGVATGPELFEPRTTPLKDTPKERIFGRSPGALGGKVDTSLKTKIDPFEITSKKVGPTGMGRIGRDPKLATGVTTKGDRSSPLKGFSFLRDTPAGRSLVRAGLAGTNLQQAEQKQRDQRAQVEADIKSGKADTSIPTYTGSKAYQQAMEVFDDGGDDTSSPDAGGPGSTDMGFSTSQGGFIPKRKKKKSMKRGGLASRK
jgi:hypothetical protein